MEDLITSRKDALPTPPQQDDLQSVRTKFKLSKDALEAKEWLSDYFDTSQKEVCDIALELTSSFLAGDEDLHQRFFERAQEQPGDPRRKSHVVSRATLKTIERQAEEHDLSRDQFIDAMLRLVRLLVERQRSKQIEHHESLLPGVRELRNHAEEVKSKVDDQTPQSDPLRRGIGQIIVSLDQLIDDLEVEVESGNPLRRDHDWL